MCIIVITEDKSYYKADERPLKQEIGIITGYIRDLDLNGQRAILYGEGLSAIMLGKAYPVRESWTWPRVRSDMVGYLANLERELNGVLQQEKLWDIERTVKRIKELLKDLAN